jgi:hypothetical protein
MIAAQRAAIQYEFCLACIGSAVIRRAPAANQVQGGFLGDLPLRKLRPFDEAIDCYEQDIAVCRDTGDRYGAGQTLDKPRRRLLGDGQPGRAAACWRDAAAAMGEVGELEEAARLEQQAANAQTGQHP